MQSINIIKTHINTLNNEDVHKFLTMYGFLFDHFPLAPGSINNKHQWRPGGYYDHIADMLTLGESLFPIYQKKLVDFNMKSIIKIVLLHDIEKPFKYDSRGIKYLNEIIKSDDDTVIRNHVIDKFNITLTHEEKNGIRYIHGEGKDYSETKRVMLPLTAFCHILDVSSARIFFDKSIAKK